MTYVQFKPILHIKKYITHINIYPNEKNGNKNFLSFNTVKNAYDQGHIYKTQDVIDCLTSAIDTYKQISSNHKIGKKIYAIKPITVDHISDLQRNDIVEALKTYNEMFNLSYVRIYSIKQGGIEETSGDIINYPLNIKKSIQNAKAIMKAAKNGKELKIQQRYMIYIPEDMKSQFLEAVQQYNTSLKQKKKIKKALK